MTPENKSALSLGALIVGALIAFAIVFMKPTPDPIAAMVWAVFLAGVIGGGLFAIVHFAVPTISNSEATGDESPEHDFQVVVWGPAPKELRTTTVANLFSTSFPATILKEFIYSDEQRLELSDGRLRLTLLNAEAGSNWQEEDCPQPLLAQISAGDATKYLFEVVVPGVADGNENQIYVSFPLRFVGADESTDAQLVLSSSPQKLNELFGQQAPMRSRLPVAQRWS